MAMELLKTTDVYGIGRDLPLNYVSRQSVDIPFTESLTREKHVVVFGSSKQGKTSLRKSALTEADEVTVSCLNTMTLNDLHGAILKAIGYRLEVSTTRSQSGSHKIIVKFAGRGKVPFLAELSGEGNYEGHRESGKDEISRPLELELADVNDVIAAITQVSFKGFIVLEDFHYLPVDTQCNFSFALKSFHENSKICFIVIGVWRDKGRLEYYNGDLTGRVVSIDADEWERDELSEVISTGERLLNIVFDEKFKTELLSKCHDAVHIVQEACLKACLDEGIVETCAVKFNVCSNVDAEKIIEEIVENQAGRYSAFITNFAEGFQRTDLEMYRWLIRAVLESDVGTLERGLRRTDISAKVKAIHPEGATLNEGNITQALQNTASLQILKSVRPIVLDYDQTTRVLHVVDKSFLIWLSHQEVHDITAGL